MTSDRNSLDLDATAGYLAHVAESLVQGEVQGVLDNYVISAIF